MRSHRFPLILSLCLTTSLPVGFLIPATFAQTEESEEALEKANQEALDEEGEASNQAKYVPANLDRTTELLNEGEEAIPGRGERLLVRTPTMGAAVSLLVATIGDRCLVTLPDGQIREVKLAATVPTDQPFRASKLAIKQSLERDGLDRFRIVGAKPYIFVYDCSEGFYRHTRAILETLYPGVKKQLEAWGIDVPDPKLPLMVVIMPNREAFDNFEKMPRDVMAYYDPLTNRVFLYEDQELSDAAPEYALKRASYIIAHEGVHQMLANVDIEKRLGRWPMWISEGLPEYLSPVKIHSRIARQGLDEMPVRSVRWRQAGVINDLRMRELLSIPPTVPGEVIEKVVHAQSLTSLGYSVSWALVHHLAKNRPKEFRAYLADIAQTKPFEGVLRERDELFEKHFGSDYAEIEDDVKRHVTSREMEKEYRDPLANQTHYIVKRNFRRGRTISISAIITLSPASAQKWKKKEKERHPKRLFPINHLQGSETSRISIEEDIEAARVIFTAELASAATLLREELLEVGLVQFHDGPDRIARVPGAVGRRCLVSDIGSSGRTRGAWLTPEDLQRLTRTRRDEQGSRIGDTHALQLARRHLAHE